VISECTGNNSTGNVNIHIHRHLGLDLIKNIPVKSVQFKTKVKHYSFSRVACLVALGKSGLKADCSDEPELLLNLLFNFCFNGRS